MISANDNYIDTQYRSAVQHTATLQKPRILIVEDEALLAMMAEDALRDAGAEIVGAAGSVTEALYLIEHVTNDGGLDAAVLDIRLNRELVTPVADRLAVLGVPFLFATGYSDAHDMGGHAAAPLLHKPFAINKLVAAVRGLARIRTSETVGA